MILITDDKMHIQKIDDSVELIVSVKDKDEGERLMQQITTHSTWIKWLEDRDLELVFCMFNCKPYLRNKFEEDTHSETTCNGIKKTIKKYEDKK